jgi:tRNA nucleotidyltransferase (CCA-adding enzyme)
LRHAERLVDAGEVLALAPADLVLALKTGPEVALAFLAAVAASRAQRRVLARYWREWRPLKLSVTGEDLKKLGLPPGPGYARILRAVLDARLAGTIRSADEERALLERLARETNHA